MSRDGSWLGKRGFSSQQLRPVCLDEDEFVNAASERDKGGDSGRWGGKEIANPKGDPYGAGKLPAVLTL